MQFNHLLATIRTYDKNSYLYEGLTNDQVKSVKLWENAALKLKEAELTADQIQQLFQTVEKGATDAGGNRTLIGKGKDAADAVNKAWEDLKTKIQNSGPIQAVDQAYDSAVAKIESGLGGPDNAVNQIIQKYRKFAKEHPIAQGFIYSALIAAAGISGAGLGGAAVLSLLKLADKLLQGEKFSTAAYQGAKTGAMAYGASKLGDYIKGKPDASAPSGTGDLAGQQAAGAPAEVTHDYNADTYRVGQMGRLGGDGQGQIGQALDPGIAPTGANGQPMRMVPMDEPASAATDAASAAASGHPGSPEDWAKGINPPPDWIKNNATGQYSPPTDVGSSAASGVASASGSTPPLGASMDPEYLQRVVDAQGKSGVRFKISPEDAKAALDWQAQNGGQVAQAAADTAAGAAKGYSKDYLEKVISGEHPRPMISKEKAQELLGQMSGGDSAGAGGQIGQALDPGIAPIGPNGQPMSMVPMDEPATAAADAAASATSSGPSLSFTNGNQGTLTLPGGESLPAYAFPEGGIQPRLPMGGEKITVDLGGQKVDAWVHNGKAYIKNFDPASIGTNLKEHQIQWLFSRVEDSIVTESVLDSIKGAAGKAMSWAQTKGKNLTTKVTADKLNSAWKSAGSPTDSEKVKAVIVKAGADAGLVDKAFADMGVAPTAPAPTPADTTTPAPADTTTPAPADTTDPSKSAEPKDELDDIKKNAGIPTTPAGSTPAPISPKVTELSAKIGKFSEADRQKIIALLQGR